MVRFMVQSLKYFLKGYFPEIDLSTVRYIVKNNDCGWQNSQEHDRKQMDNNLNGFSNKLAAMKRKQYST
jgi:hypothetical protein